MSSSIKIRRVVSQRDMAQALAIRLRVFVKEQGVPEDIELDSDDARAIHFIATASGNVVGTARLVVRRGSAKIGRMAVLRSRRGHGVGKKLLQHAVATAKKGGASKIYLHAQVAAIGFYEKRGFRCLGPVFDEAGIPHRTMIYK
jgi:predicted GNAT family N-acyltransferase